MLLGHMQSLRTLGEGLHQRREIESPDLEQGSTRNTCCSACQWRYREETRSAAVLGVLGSDCNNLY